MSGLAGWIDYECDLTKEQDTFGKMVAKLAMRGRDAQPGCWYDADAAMAQGAELGTTARGSQPCCLHTAEGSIVLAISGKVDNLEDLTRRLKPLDAGVPPSTSQILMDAYLKWGRNFVSRVDGMFAFAVWDGRQQKLLLGRDRLGLQPLYYFAHPNGVLFGSEPKVLLANPLFTARLNLESIGIALQPRLALPGETQLRGLLEVPAGHVLTLCDGSIASTRYWSLESRPHTEEFDQTARRVRELLAEAVATQVTHHRTGPVGAMLSGGLDSTSVAALSVQALRGIYQEADLRTYCIHFEEPRSSFAPSAIRPDIDSPYASLAAAHLGCKHATVYIGSEQIASSLADARRARDLPGWGQMDASMLTLFREMKQECRVAVTGEVADELFGGYPQYFDQALVNRAQFPWLDEGPRLGSYLSKELFPTFNAGKDEQARYHQVLSDVPRLYGEEPGNARMREILYVSMAGRLAVLLDRMDRMSMAAGIQVRFPFCDHRLVQYVWNIPWAMKTHQGMKGLLKAAMRDLLPGSTLDRKKSAYPHIQDAEYDLALADEALAVLDDPNAAVAPLFDVPQLRTFLQTMKAQGQCKRKSHLLVQLIELERWMRSYEVSIA